MIPVERPDLNQVDPEVIAYIEYLESQVRIKTQTRARRDESEEPEYPPPLLEPTEPPTTLNVITMTRSGIAKRTPRHLYTRQRRGGMGVFDLDTPEDEPPEVLLVADQSQHLLLFTDQARAFRIPVSSIPETPVHARGQVVIGKLAINNGEGIVCALTDQAKGAVAMVSQRGFVRELRHHVFGEYMKPGTTLFDYKQHGPLVAASWTPGDGELFIATRGGRAIRFSEKLVPPVGVQGIRLDGEDVTVAITPVYEDSGVFLLSADGKGTIRMMEGFNPNKSTGGSGKNALITNHLVSAVVVEEQDDIFIISELSKIIRFMAEEVPEKEGVVQGVICMILRGDVCRVAAISSRNP